MRIESTAYGPPELVREDGWRYRLEGVIGLDFDLEDDLYHWGAIPQHALPARSVLTVTIAVLSDKTLDSIRVLRDELTDCSIRLQHDY